MGPIRGQPIYFKVNNRALLTFQEQTSTEVPNQKVPRLFSYQSVSGDDPDGRGFKDQRDFRSPHSNGAGLHFKDVLVKKSDGCLRSIFDLRALNTYVATKHFYLISQVDVVNFFQANYWLVKDDLHQAYFHLCVAETHRRFLRVVYNGEILQLTALPYGLFSAPRTFAAVGIKLGGRDPAPARSACSSVPQRLPLGVPGQIQTVGTGCGNAGHCGVPGLACKLQ